MRRVLLLLATLLLAAGCGGSGKKAGTTEAATAPPTESVPTETTPAGGGPVVKPHPTSGTIKVTITAPTHRPKVNAAWRYVVRVTEKGKPVRSRLYLQVLFRGAPVGNIGTHLVNGVWRETIRWPAASRGHPLVFQATAVATGRVAKAQYPISVQ